MLGKHAAKPQQSILLKNFIDKPEKLIKASLMSAIISGDANDPPDAAVKFKLGTEKYKSKVGN